MRGTAIEGPRSRRRRGAPPAVVAIVAWTLAACGSGSPSTATTVTSTTGPGTSRTSTSPVPAPSSPETSGPPSATGGITFRRYLDSSETSGALFTTATDGSCEQQITDPPASAVDDNPDWSPDGTRLLFTRYAGLGTDHESHRLFTVSSDGTRVTPLSPDVTAHGDIVEGFDDTGVFSPDGTRIAFSYGHGQVAKGGTHGIPVGSDQLEFSGILAMDADGGNRHEVTNDAAYSGDSVGVAWSPDGTKLVYARFNSGAADPPNGQALFIVDVDGSNQRQLTPWDVGAGGTPDWSPATDLIVFRGVTDEESGVGNFFTIHPDGTALTQITEFTNTVISHKVGFSPDGLWVVFAKTATNGRNDVFIAKADGSSVRPVTHTAQADSSPDWTSQ